MIIGAGPAGLTAGCELLKQSGDYEVIILEESHMAGGISRTVDCGGNRMDMGGHRFFLCTGDGASVTSSAHWCSRDNIRDGSFITFFENILII